MTHFSSLRRGCVIKPKHTKCTYQHPLPVLSRVFLFRSDTLTQTTKFIFIGYVSYLLVLWIAPQLSELQHFPCLLIHDWGYQQITYNCWHNIISATFVLDLVLWETGCSISFCPLTMVFDLVLCAIGWSNFRSWFTLGCRGLRALFTLGAPCILGP